VGNERECVALTVLCKRVAGVKYSTLGAVIDALATEAGTPQALAIIVMQSTETPTWNRQSSDQGSECGERAKRGRKGS
jgi:hypothetical protein